MRASTLTGLAAILLVLAAATVAGLPTFTNPDTARIPAVAGLAFSVEVITWGTVYPGQSYSKAFRATNMGNVPLTLNVTAWNWSPTNASRYLGLTSNATGITLSPGMACGIGLVLVVAPRAPPGDFAFDITVA